MGIYREITPVAENSAETNMENKMEAGGYMVVIYGHIIYTCTHLFIHVEGVEKPRGDRIWLRYPLSHCNMFLLAFEALCLYWLA